MILLNNHLVNVTRFPNGEITIRPFPEGVVDQDHNRIIWKYESNEDIFVLRLLENMLEPHNLMFDPECHILYMPYSRMDRREEGHPFSLDVIVEMLPFTFNYTIYEPHSDKTATTFEDHGKFPTIEYYTPQLLKGLLSEKDFWDIDKLKESPLVLVFPDKGAKQRYSYPHLEIYDPEDFHSVVYCEKDRDFDTGEINGLKLETEKDLPENFRAIILDDLSSFGNTFIRTSKVLREHGAKEVHLIVGHAEDSVFKGDLLNHVDSLSTTDSITSVNAYMNDKVAITSAQAFIELTDEEENA